MNEKNNKPCWGCGQQFEVTDLIQSIASEHRLKYIVLCAECRSVDMEELLRKKGIEPEGHADEPSTRLFTQGE